MKKSEGSKIVLKIPKTHVVYGTWVPILGPFVGMGFWLEQTPLRIVPGQALHSNSQIWVGESSPGVSKRQPIILHCPAVVTYHLNGRANLAD